MIEFLTSTLDTREAAACGTLGIPAKLETTVVESTGRKTTRFHLALQCTAGLYQTKPILTAYRNRTLAEKEPLHPFVTIQRGFLNRMAVLDFQNKGTRLRLARVPGTEVWQYLLGNEPLPGIHGCGEVLKTTDLKLVAALGVVGIPLLMLEGTGRSHRYLLPRYGPVRGDGLPPVDGAALMEAWRRDKAGIPWENPFAQAMRGLYNRERFLDAVNRDIALVLLTKPGHRLFRSAFVPENAGDAALDRAKRHLDA